MRSLNPHEMYTWATLHEQGRLPLPLLTVRAVNTLVDYCRMGSFTICVLVAGRRFYVGVAKRACGLDTENPITGRAIAFVRTLERGCEFFHRFPGQVNEDALEPPDAATVVLHPSVPGEADWGALSDFHDDDAYESAVGVSLPQYMDESNGSAPHDDWCHDEPQFDFAELRTTMEEEVDRSRGMLTMGVRPSIEHLVSAYVALTDKALFDSGGELPNDALLWLLQGWHAIADTLLAIRPLWHFAEEDEDYRHFLDLGSHMAELAVAASAEADDGPVESVDPAGDDDHAGEPFRVAYDADDDEALPPVLTFAIIRRFMHGGDDQEIAA